MYTEEEYLQLSGIQHFAFCRRQWALIHIEKQWEENFLTADGRIMHQNAHNPEFREKRKDKIIVRAIHISSETYGLSGECDIVEFHRDDKNGISLSDMEGNYTVFPVEYKRGKPKKDDCDCVQLCAQALCLEEMLCCDIPEGYLYYGEIKRRVPVALDKALREKTMRFIEEMHQLYARKYTPKCKRTKSCNACSLKDICLPSLDNHGTVSEYLQEFLGEL